VIEVLATVRTEREAGAVDQAVELARAERDAGRLGEVSARLATLKSQIAGGGA